MGEWEITCSDCGWQGSASELTEETDNASGQSLKFCPDCGGFEFEKPADHAKRENH